MQMKNFKVGDIVVALTNPRTELCQSRIKGNEYNVGAILYCPHCGSQKINIGCVGTMSTLLCNSCGKGGIPNNGLAWTDSKHFILKEDMQETLEEALQDENYDLAILLRDLEIPVE